jgi:hypothetical protein
MLVTYRTQVVSLQVFFKILIVTFSVDHKLFSTGKNDEGQLALGHTEDVYAFQQVEFPAYCSDRELMIANIGHSHSFYTLGK